MGKRHGNTVGNLEILFLTQVLYTLHQFTGRTLHAKRIRHGNIERHRQAAFIGHRPAGNVLTENLHVGHLDGYRLAALQGHAERAFAFQLSYLFLCQALHRSGHVLHQFTELLAHRTEVALHFLHQHAIAFHKLQFLDVHFVQNQLFHGFYAFTAFGVTRRYGNALQGLTHDNPFFLAQGQDHGRNLLRQFHTIL